MTTEELAEEDIQARMDALAEPLRTKVAEAIKRLMPESLPTGPKSDSD